MNRTALHRALHMTIAAGLLVATAAPGFAQEGRPAPRTAKDVAPIDLTGYWESRIVDEWRFRVTRKRAISHGSRSRRTPAKPPWLGIPQRTKQKGKACRAYGAVGITQRPGLMHITWSDPRTLKMDFDTGTQTRMVHFAKAPAIKVLQAGKDIRKPSGRRPATF